MSELSPPLAHQFEDLKQQRDTATLGMWTFLITEILFFGGLFAGYAEYRYRYYEAFVAGSRHLDILLGAINTAVLIASSFTVVMSIHAAGIRRRKMIVTFLLLTILLGLVFLGIKAVEYTHKFEEQLVPGANFKPGAPASEQLFFSFYFGMTGMHALHMIIGIGIMSVMAFRAWRGSFSNGYTAPLEVAGLYWHFVDIVWIFLFPLLYLLGRHH